MVVIHIKNTEQDQFLYETQCSTPNDDMVRDIVKVWNMRLRLALLSGALREMAKYGPMKEPSKAGLDEVKERYEGVTIEKSEFYAADPTGVRTGCGVGPQLTETIERVCLDIESVLGPVSFPNLMLDANLLYENWSAQSINLTQLPVIFILP